MNSIIGQRGIHRPLVKVFLGALGLSVTAMFPFVGKGRAQTSESLPKPDFHHLHEYFSVLEHSPLPRAQTIRNQIARGPVRLEEERAAARQEGIPLEATELRGVVPPPEEDAGPLYAQLEAGKWPDWAQLPYYANPLRFDYRYTPEQISAVESALENHDGLTALIHEAADKPYCSFIRESDKIYDIGKYQKPSYSTLRTACRRLLIESYLQACKGHYAESITNGSRGFRVAQHLGSDIGLISYLGAQTCEIDAELNMTSILIMAGPNQAVDRQVQDAIAEYRPQLSLQHGISTEVPVELGIFEFSRRGGPQSIARELGRELEGRIMGPSTIPEQQFLSPEDKRLITDLLDAQEAGFIHQFRLIFGVAATPSVERRRAFSQFAQVEADNPAHWWVKELGFLERLDNTDDLIQANEAVIMAAAAVMGDRGKSGTYPAQFPGPFTDPFTGKPLGYRREGADGFVVYSAGRDGTFDGGGAGGMSRNRGVLFRYPPPLLKPAPPPPSPKDDSPSAPPGATLPSPATR